MPKQLLLILLCCCSLFVKAQSAKNDSLSYYLDHCQELISTNVGKAELYIQRARFLAEKADAKNELLSAIRFQGLIAYYNGEYPKALGTWLEGLKLAEKYKLRSAESSLLNEIANLYKKQNELQKSLVTFNKALQIAEEVNDSLQMANVLNNIGVAYQDNKEFERALKAFKKSVELKEGYGDTVSTAYNYANIGTLLGTMGKFDEALDYINRSTEIRIRIKDTRNLAINYTLLAEIYDQQGNRSVSRQYYFKSLSKAQEVSYTDLQKYIYEQVANTYAADNDYKLAYEYKEKAISLKDSLFNKERSMQIAELDKKYQSAKREQDLAEHKKALAESKLTIDNRNNTILLVCVILGFIVIIAFVLIKQQKHKNSQLATEMALKQQLAQIEAVQKLQYERERIAKDLHDNIGAQLSFIGMQLDGMQYKYSEQLELVDKVQLIASYARQSSAQLRETIWAINNEAVSLEMLTAKLREYVAKQNELNTSKQISVRLLGNSAIELSPARSLALFRVCQEAINNAEKHANFNELTVTFSGENNVVLTQITDDGSGFDVDAVKRKGQGLANMKHRIKEVGGEFAIRSQLGQGTQLNIKLQA